MRRSWGSWVLGLMLLARVADAQQAYQSDYALEIYSGPVLAPVNITGMGGAFTSVAEGSGAQFMNPVAVANRYFYNGDEWYDWDWSVDWLGLASSGGSIGTDLDNNGASDAGADGVFSIVGSLSFNFGRFGIGLFVSARDYSLCFDPAAEQCATSEQLRVGDISGTYSIAYGFFDGELLVGAQMVATGINVDVGLDDSSPTASKNGGGGLGLLWRPHTLPIRIGASFQTTANPDLDVTPGDTIGDLLLPTRLARPWRLALGFSWQFGARPYNLQYSFGDADIWGSDPESHGRGYHLLSLDVVMVGASTKAVGFDGWLQQLIERAGERPSISVHLGYETEFWDNFLRGRLGTYLEPSRFRTGAYRVHGTGGLDVRLFELVWEWRFAAGFDVAPRYTNLMLSLGFWH